jgi:hypothetical protein
MKHAQLLSHLTHTHTHTYTHIRSPRCDVHTLLTTGIVTPLDRSCRAPYSESSSEWSLPPRSAWCPTSPFTVKPKSAGGQRCLTLAQALQSVAATVAPFTQRCGGFPRNWSRCSWWMYRTTGFIARITQRGCGLVTRCTTTVTGACRNPEGHIGVLDHRVMGCVNRV